MQQTIENTKFTQPLSSDDLFSLIQQVKKNPDAILTFEITSKEFGLYALALSSRLKLKKVNFVFTNKEIFFEIFNAWLKNFTIQTIVEPFFSIVSNYVQRKVFSCDCQPQQIDNSLNIPSDEIDAFLKEKIDDFIKELKSMGGKYV